MEKAKRYLVFLIGLLVSAFGIALITKAGLGTSPISSVPYVLSLNLPFSLGNFTIAISLLLVVAQLLILRKNFKAEYWLQVPISLVFGYLIDFSMYILRTLSSSVYIGKLLFLLLGCLVLGFGVYCEMLANVAMLPGESFVRAVAVTWNFDFGTVKIWNDATYVVIAIILSLLFKGKLEGVREGTVVAAFLVGYTAKTIAKYTPNLADKLFKDR